MGEVIGYASMKVSSSYSEKSVINANGEVIGKVDEEGIVRDRTGAPIGTVDGKGIAHNTGGTIIGFVPAIMKNPYTGFNAYDIEGLSLGTINSNGNLIGKNGTVLGIVNNRAIVKDSQGKVVAIVPSNAVSNLLGLKVYGRGGEVIGNVDSEGMVTDKGSIIGSVDSQGIVKDTSGKLLGFVPASNFEVRNDLIGHKVLGLRGETVGIIGKDGLVRTPGDKIVGRVEISGLSRSMQGEKNGVSASQVFSASTALRLVGQPVIGKVGNFIGIVLAIEDDSVCCNAVPSLGSSGILDEIDPRLSFWNWLVFMPVPFGNFDASNSTEYLL